MFLFIYTKKFHFFVRSKREEAIPAFPSTARLAQLVERQPFKLVVVGSSPTVGSVVFLSVLLFECSGCICCCVIAVDTQAPWPNG